MSGNVDAARKFYVDLLGWATEDAPPGLSIIPWGKIQRHRSVHGGKRG
jgi:predicted enzyme related to lactoylglutathione lyase